MYSIDLESKNLKGAKSGKMFLLSSSGKVPYEASAFAPNFLIPPTEILDIGYYQLTFSYLENNRLQAPYDTNCIDYKSFMNVSSSIECFTKCTNDMVKKYFGKGHFIAITYNTDDKVDPRDDTRDEDRIINQDEIDDESTAELLNQLEERCVERCSRMDCNQRYTITQVFSDPNDVNITIKYIVSSPQEPFVTIGAIPRLELLEYLIFILSSTSIWFGFHILMLDPRKLGWIPNEGKTDCQKKCGFCEVTRRRLLRGINQTFNQSRSPSILISRCSQSE